MTSERRIKHTADEWRQLIEEQRRGEESQDVFCEARGLGRSTFQAWKRRLYGKKKESTLAATRAPVPAQDMSGLFTPLAPPVAESGSRDRGMAGWTVELQLGGGLCLRLRRSA